MIRPSMPTTFLCLLPVLLLKESFSHKHVAFSSQIFISSFDILQPATFDFIFFHFLPLCTITAAPPQPPTPPPPDITNFFLSPCLCLNHIWVPADLIHASHYLHPTLPSFLTYFPGSPSLCRVFLTPPVACGGLRCRVYGRASLQPCYIQK